MPTTPKVSVMLAVFSVLLGANTQATTEADAQIGSPSEPARLPGAGSLYIDHDGDGYGPASPLGADADDSDALVNTPDTVKAKYGDNIGALLAKRGYRPGRIFYIAVNGNNASAQADALTKPFATFDAVVGRLRAGDAVLFLAGTYKGKYPVVCQKVAGSDDQPILVAAYPGHRVVIDGASCCVGLEECRNLTFDSLTLISSSGASAAGVSMHYSSRIVLRNIESRGHKWGVHGMQDLHDILMESCVLHDNPGEHGVYLGCRDLANTRVTLRNSLSYRNGRNGFQHNGRVTELLLENNSFHTNTLAGISFINGVSGAVVRDNLIYNNNKQGIVMYTYNDANPGIIPYSQNGNLFERNTVWVGQRGWNGQYEPLNFPAVQFTDSTTAQTVLMSDNIFRDNVLVTQRGPALSFKQRRFLAVTGVENNIIYRMAGPGACLESVPQTVTFAAMAALSNRIQGNKFEDPKFRDVSVNYFAAPEKFDFSRSGAGGAAVSQDAVVQPLAAAVPFEVVAVPPAAAPGTAVGTPAAAIARARPAAVLRDWTGGGSRTGVGVFYWDDDGDGYGTAGPLGPDASDSDAALSTPDTIESRYRGNLQSLLAKLGYHPQRIFYVAANGSDTTGRADDAAQPYATFASVRRELKAGDAVLFREGTYSGKYPLILRGISGTGEEPILIAAYPGHRVVIEGQLACAVVDHCRYVTLEGLTLVSSGAAGASAAAGLDMQNSSQIVLRNIESRGHKWGLRGSEDLHDILIERCVFHDNTAQGLYLASRMLPNSRVTIRKCLSYRNGAAGFQNDGRITELVMSGDVVHTNAGEGILLSNGVSRSYLRDNLIFNNARQGIALYAYDDREHKIVAYDQNANLVEGNTVWVGRRTWQDSRDPAAAAAVQFNDVTVAQKVQMSDNVLRSNVLVTQDGPALSFKQKRFTAGTVVENNTLFRSAGEDFAMEYGPQAVSFKLMEGLGSRIRANRFEDPRFTDVSADYFARPEKFDFSKAPAAAAAPQP
ncbi:MAG: right-handed parallel beta-helix repeat-containing protein [Planctomycetaceae bacterium]|nr:right-handed parallel beta-helix repeat-containing protein [Planctomycetaceae bacterium]